MGSVRYVQPAAANPDNASVNDMMRTRIAIGSVTYAEKGKNALAAHGIAARTVRLEPCETKNGCAFALEIAGNHAVSELREILLSAHVRFSEILTDELPML